MSDVSGVSDLVRRDSDGIRTGVWFGPYPGSLEHAAATASLRMSAPDLIIRGRRVVLPDTVGPCSIHIRDERIVKVGDYDDVVSGCELIQVDDDSVVMPGLVDTHVHVNSPGRTEWEGFRSATLAAAAGGVMTVVDMPLNSIPPTTTLAGFKTKLETAHHECFVDVGFWGGVVPGNTRELAPMFAAG